jgi:hypothetical protein
MVKRIFKLPNLSNLVVIAPALLLYGAALLPIKQYQNVRYQLLLLASTLLFVVCFSTGSESPTFVIALVGVAIWYVTQQPKQIWHHLILAFVFVGTCFVATDLVPYYVKVHYIRPYALKVLPCFLVWLVTVYIMISYIFAPISSAKLYNEKSIGSNTNL